MTMYSNIQAANRSLFVWLFFLYRIQIGCEGIWYFYIWPSSVYTQLCFIDSLK